MKIQLRHSSPDHSGYDGRVIMKEFEIPEGTDISDILPQVHASGLAKYVFDGFGSGGKVVAGYLTTGKLEEGVTYNICSESIPKTIKALDKLKKLKFK